MASERGEIQSLAVPDPRAQEPLFHRTCLAWLAFPLVRLLQPVEGPRVIRRSRKARCECFARLSGLALEHQQRAQGLACRVVPVRGFHVGQGGFELDGRLQLTHCAIEIALRLSNAPAQRVARELGAILCRDFPFRERFEVGGCDDALDLRELPGGGGVAALRQGNAARVTPYRLYVGER